jgi:type I restriction enzyme, R subunit
MLGRGTRLRPHLFGPGRHKEFFYVFDFCQNFEFFNQNPDVANPKAGAALSERLFATRVELVSVLDKALSFEAKITSTGEYRQAAPVVLYVSEPDGSMDHEAKLHDLRNSTARLLHEQVLGMNVDNFLVRAKRRLVEKFSRDEAWKSLGLTEQAELRDEVASLPSDVVDDDIVAKQFDLLIVRTQIAILESDTSYTGLRTKVVGLAGLLEELGNVPMVAKEMPLILEIQTDEYWQDITAPMLESVRQRLRSLIKLIEATHRPTLYTDFEDEIGKAMPMVVPGVVVGTDMDRFRAKARHFLMENSNHIAVLKLRRNEPLTAADLSELEKIFVAAGVEPEQIDRIRTDVGLGLFVRSLVGMDREAAKAAFADFLQSKTTTASQIEFLNMIIDQLTERGAMDPRLLYESPFTDIDPLGVEGIFGHQKAVEVVTILDEITRRAAA